MEKLNHLSYRIFEIKEEFLPDFWFELLIDNESVERITNDEKAIPYYYFTDNEEIDLPSYVNYEDEKLFFLAVCSCGDAGCGSLATKLVKDNEYVNFQVINERLRRNLGKISFRFTKENYNTVIREIKSKAKEIELKANKIG